MEDVEDKVKWGWAISPIKLPGGNFITVDCIPAEDTTRGYVFVRNSQGWVIRGSAFVEGRYKEWVLKFIEEYGNIGGRE